MSIKFVCSLTSFLLVNQVFANVNPDFQTQLNWIKEELESTQQNVNRLEKENVELKQMLNARDPVEDRLLKLEELTKILSLRTCEEYARYGLGLLFVLIHF